MPASPARQLVIDADIARSSGGEEATFPKSAHRRDFLKAVVFRTGHAAVLSPDVETEWKKHGSRFFRRWLVEMYGRRRVRRIPDCRDEPFRRRVSRLPVGDPERAIMLHDCHLLEAALATGHTVVSTDDQVRGHFTRACHEIREIRVIVWADPDRDCHDVIRWVTNGAPLERERTMGYAADVT